MAQDRKLARRRLDARLGKLARLTEEPRPHMGWTRAIRNALGMSRADLAARMGVVHQTVADLERSEMHDTIRLESLRRVADALDCDVAYFLIPRTSLEEAVQEQALRKARRHIAVVAHQSRLEDQAVTDDDTAEQIKELSERLVDSRGLWHEPDPAR